MLNFAYFISAHGFGHATRASAVMAAIRQRKMRGIEIGEPEFRAGAWVDRLPEMLALPRLPRPAVNGAAQAADFICRLVQIRKGAPGG
jgi:hypothetical protein